MIKDLKIAVLEVILADCHNRENLWEQNDKDPDLFEVSDGKYDDYHHIFVRVNPKKESVTYTVSDGKYSVQEVIEGEDFINNRFEISYKCIERLKNYLFAETDDEDDVEEQ